MITCKLVNKSGNSDLGKWTGRSIPRIGEKLVVRKDPAQWGQVLLVVDVINYSDRIELHVKYHSGEQHL